MSDCIKFLGDLLPGSSATEKFNFGSQSELTRGAVML